MRKAIPSSRAGEYGYTLVELLVVLAVIALLITATPAVVSAARPGAEARAATYAIADALRAARAAAIVSDTERIILLDLPNRSYITADQRVRRLPERIEWDFEGPTDAMDEQQVQIRFYSDGSSSGGRIRIQGAGRNRVIISHKLTGRTSIDE